MTARKLLRSLPMLCLSIILLPTALGAQVDAPPVPSYADAVTAYEGGRKPGKLSAEDHAVMQHSAAELAEQLPEPGLKVGERAPNFTLPNAFGKPVSLSKQLAKGPVVLTFYRGAWCPYCNLELKALHGALPHMENLGARLIAVTPQQPGKSLEQVKKDGYPFEILSDLDSTVMRDYRLYFAVPKALSDLYRDRFGLDLATYNGPGRYELPVPGTFVIDRHGIVRAAFADTNYKRRMEPEDIIAALRTLTNHDAGRVDPGPLVNELGMAFVEVPAGMFIMGTHDLEAAAMERPDGELAQIRDEAPPHSVRFPEPFWLGRTEVTQGQWLEVMGTRPGPESEWQRDDWRTLPVVSVTWFDVQAFIAALEKRTQGISYRLPTEAEWEYAARAGTQALRPMPVEKLPDYAWYIENSGDVAQPVATRKANIWGLHDMFGNVWEWTADWYAPDYYVNTPAVAPQGQADGNKKVRRGGSYHCQVHMVRPGYRSADDPARTYSVVGFRLIAEPNH
ncbi:MAG: SUMF1/EgtB/PvdO family nonheme iron enzyme [Pseudomonadota bacterium]|nr:SUMF1/EgtB/PvdO family nonheme iron enzyme [Pseudomonadota bacterium]